MSSQKFFRNTVKAIKATDDLSNPVPTTFPPGFSIRSEYPRTPVCRGATQATPGETMESCEQGPHGVDMTLVKGVQDLMNIISFDNNDEPKIKILVTRIAWLMEATQETSSQ